jgi:hypothetical protein
MLEKLFGLRVSPLRGMRPIHVECYSTGVDYRGATTYRISVRHERRDVFPLATSPLYGAFSPLHSVDGNAAREHVLSHVSMRPSDGSGVEDDFYSSYTPEQLAWCEKWGESLHCESQARYCDPETGEPRDDR